MPSTGAVLHSPLVGPCHGPRSRARRLAASRLGPVSESVDAIFASLVHHWFPCDPAAGSPSDWLPQKNTTSETLPVLMVSASLRSRRHWSAPSTAHPTPLGGTGVHGWKLRVAVQDRHRLGQTAGGRGLGSSCPGPCRRCPPFRILPGRPFGHLQRGGRRRTPLAMLTICPGVVPCPRCSTAWDAAAPAMRCRSLDATPWRSSDDGCLDPPWNEPVGPAERRTRSLAYCNRGRRSSRSIAPNRPRPTAQCPARHLRCSFRP